MIHNRQSPLARPTLALIGILTVFSGCRSESATQPKVEPNAKTDANAKTAPAPGPAIAGGMGLPPTPADLADVDRGIGLADPKRPLSPIRFEETTNTGVTSPLCSGNDVNKYFPTSLGSGVTLLDYDQDGLLDIYLPTTRNLPRSAPNQSGGNRLFRNRGGFQFEDVTKTAGVGYNGFCHGAAVGDVNQDGRPDLYLTNLGGNVLYVNQGDGTFRNATAGSGAECGLWCTGAAFLDYNRDGFLDLYVTCYGRWTENQDHPYCGDPARKIRIICSPFSITPERHFLFQGRGDGTFVETTQAAGVLRQDGRGLGVVAADVNLDGWIDLYVANDGCPNFLFLNNKQGGFRDASESSGAATDENGRVQGSMGVDIQDVNGDEYPELFVTNFRGQYNTLYHNLQGENMQDVSAQAGIVAASRIYVGWGCALADFDNDGHSDMFVVNGEVDDNLSQLGQNIPYAQPTVVWRHDGGKTIRFTHQDNPGPFFQTQHPARGAAFGDLDNDGDMDVVISRMDQPPAILKNSSEPRSWIRFDLRTAQSNRSAIGARIAVTTSAGAQYRQIKGGDSYLGANDRRPLFGLGVANGPGANVTEVRVIWPNGAESILKDKIATNQTHLITEPASAHGKIGTDPGKNARTEGAQP